MNPRINTQFSHRKADIEPPFYNCSSSAVKPVTMSEMVAMARPLSYEYPFDDVLWPSYAFTTKSQTLLLVATLFLHMLPAMILDTVLKLKGKRPRWVDWTFDRGKQHRRADETALDDGVRGGGGLNSPPRGRAQDVRLTGTPPAPAMRPGAA